MSARLFAVVAAAVAVTGSASAQLRTSMPAAPVRTVPTFSPGVSTALYPSIPAYTPYIPPLAYTNPYSGVTSASAQSYNPYTGTYTQVGQSYNPYTGVSATNTQAYNPYTGNTVTNTRVMNPFGGVFNRMSGGNVFTGQSFSNTSRFNPGFGLFGR